MGENNYGYILCRINENKFADYNVYLKIVMNAIAQAYEYTSKIQEGRNLERENSDLAMQSRMDELTGILNRRGFIEKGQAALGRNEAQTRYRAGSAARPEGAHRRRADCGARP